MGDFWKKLAVDIGISSYDLDVIKKEALTVGDRAFKILRQLSASISIDDIRERLWKIKEEHYDTQLRSLVFPENIQNGKKF